MANVFVGLNGVWQTHTQNMPFMPLRHNMVSDMSLILYGVPSAPGWSRVFVTMVGEKGNGKQLPNPPGMPAFIRGMVNAIAKCKPLFHALIQNNIIGGCLGGCLLSTAPERQQAKREEHVDGNGC